MIQKALPAAPSQVLYPDSDGEPLAENTKQLRWIVVLFGNLCSLFDERADVFVAADLFWYPVEGEPDVRTAPDVLVVFGRPKGDRGSYMQWEEDNIPLTVVFEILSPGNTYQEMDDKQDFYETHGVQEYYVYDPDNNRLRIFTRRGDVLVRVRPASGFVSPRLGIRFDLSGPELVVYGPDGQRFSTFAEVQTARREAEQRAAEAQQQAAEAQQQAAEAQRRAARLVELGRKVRQGQASGEELQELERLEEQSLPAPPP
jgi:Uma2 family endonuclease